MEQYFTDFGFIDKINKSITSINFDDEKQIVSNDDYLFLKQNKDDIQLILFNNKKNVIGNIKKQLKEKNFDIDNFKIIPYIDLTEIIDFIKSKPTDINTIQEFLNGYKDLIDIISDLYPYVKQKIKKNRIDILNKDNNLLEEIAFSNIFKKTNEEEEEEEEKIKKEIEIIEKEIEIIENSLGEFIIYSVIQLLEPQIENINQIYNTISSLFKLIETIEYKKILVLNNLILSFKKYKNNFKLFYINNFLYDCEYKKLDIVNQLSFSSNIDYIINYYNLEKKEILINTGTYERYRYIVKSFISKQNKKYYQLDKNINFEDFSDIITQNIEGFNKSDFYELINIFIKDDLIEEYKDLLNLNEEYLEWLNKPDDKEIKEKYKQILEFFNKKSEYKIDLNNIDEYIKNMKELDRKFGIKEYQSVDYPKYYLVFEENKETIYKYIVYNKLKKNIYKFDVARIKKYEQIKSLDGIDKFAKHYNTNTLSELNNEINEKYNINKFINNCVKNIDTHYYLKYLFDVAKIQTEVKMVKYSLNITNINNVVGFKEYINNYYNNFFIINKIEDNGLEYIISNLE